MDRGCVRRRVAITSLFVFAGPLYADNGSVAYAMPAGSFVIDGDLADWPYDARPYDINLRPDGERDSTGASFRLAYHAQSRSLIVAVEVPDESHVSGAPSTPWYEQDTLLLYIDPRHTANGSAAWALQANGDRLTWNRPDSTFDPGLPEPDLDDIELGFSHRDGHSVYEWRVGLGEHFRVGSTFGIDLIVADKDQESDTPILDRIHAWGKYFGKSRRAGYIGDVILLDPEKPTGRVTGTLAWADGIEDVRIRNRRVRATSLDNPRLWIQQPSDDQAGFELELPPGRYALEAPFPIYGGSTKVRVPGSDRRVITVRSDQTTDMGEWIWNAQSPPAIDTEPGLLFNWTEDHSSRFSRFVRAAMDHYAVPAASIAVISDGAVVYREVLGAANLVADQPADEGTLFDSGSVTKTVFAFAVNRLAEKGVIDIDRPLHEYLSFEELEEDERYRLMTARHVLSHQSGLPNWADETESGKPDLAFAPGTGFRYSGEGFEYLGRIIEHLTGKPLDSVMYEEALRPMGIDAGVYFTENDAVNANRAYGHDLYRAHAPRGVREPHAAHGMFTEADAFSGFLIGLIERKGLGSAAYDQMWSEHVDTGKTLADLDWKVSYGLGMKLIDTPFGTAIGHSGRNWGSECVFEIFPEHRAGFVVFTNGSTGQMFYRDLRRFLMTGNETE